MGGGVSQAPHLTPRPSCCFLRGSASPRLGARNHVHKAGEACAFLPPLRRSWGPLLLSGVLLLAGWRGAGQGLWGRGAARGARGESGRPFAARASPQGACLREAGSRGESWRGWRGGPFGGNRALPGGREAAWSCGAGQPPRELFAWRVWREGIPGLWGPSWDVSLATGLASPRVTGDVKGSLLAECVAPPHSVVYFLSKWSSRAGGHPENEPIHTP